MTRLPTKTGLHLTALSLSYAISVQSKDGTIPPRLRRRLESNDCDKALWHPDADNSDGCSNSLTYPAAWEGVQGLFHTSFQSCCQFFLPDQKCKKYDYCDTTDGAEDGTTTTSTESVVDVGIETGDCTSSQWHPDMTNQDGCSNGIDDYPEEWVNKKGMIYFFDSPQACCDFFFRTPGLSCEIYKKCGDPSETAKPTAKPSAPSSSKQPSTLRSTNQPSTRSPTASPTSAAPVTPQPTYFPSISPTTTPPKYYQVFSTGICTLLDAYTPYWLKEEDFFIDYTKCCEASWNTEPCLAARPPGACCTPMPTRRPTKLPTDKPTTAEPTPYPTGLIECPEATWWHPSDDFSKCTNSAGYDSNWDSPPMDEFYLHKSLSSCCEAFFDGWGKACVFEDVCAMPDTTKTSTTATTSAKPCNATKWHPSEDGSTCTNSHGFPAQWSSPSLSELYLHGTAQSCCQVHFFALGKSCVIVDICAQDYNPYAQPTKPTSSPTAARLSPLCDDAADHWHPTEDKSKCSNSRDYPEVWNHASLQKAYLHDTADECCKSFFFSWGKSCKLEDVCADAATTTTTTTTTTAAAAATTTTTTTKISAAITTMASSSCGSIWHPSPGYNACTNDPTFPSSWSLPSMRDSYLFDSKTSCCNALFVAHGKDCVVLESCSGVSETTGAHDVIENNDSTTVATTTSSSSTADSSCELTTWHPSTSFDHCTNDPQWPQSWTFGQYLHADKEDCCNMFFNSLDCVIKDSCTDTLYTLTSTEPTATSEESCESRLFHPTTDFQSCTNSLDHPESWMWPGMKDQYMFNSQDACCNQYFFLQGNDCEVIDKCTGVIATYQLPTEAPTSKPTELPCESRRYHPKTDYKSCTNSLDYPAGWENLDGQYMFPTAEDCCTAFDLFSDGECLVHDGCSNTSIALKPAIDIPTNPADLPEDITTTTTTISNACESNMYHPSSGFTACTNSPVYPASWDSPSSSMLHKTAERCCEVYFHNHGKDCMVEEFCSGKITTLKPPTRQPSNKPTSQPTKQQRPTHSPTKRPISASPSSRAPTKAPLTAKPTPGKPTEKPTKPPTASPTRTMWYPDRNPNYAEGRCITTLPVPQFRDMYDTLRKCCESAYSGQSSGACLSAEETVTESTTSTSSTTTILQYYSNPSSGMCATVDGDTPSWITTFYTDWEECCKAGWMFDKCMEENPTIDKEHETLEEETSTTTTTTTIVQYYSNPSNGMCATVDVNTPSWINIFFTTWDDCCKVGWVYDKCMAEAPVTLDEVEEETIESSTTTTTTSSSSTTLKETTTTSTSDPCKSALWHPVTATRQICTNSESYPSSWNDPALKDKYLFSSAKECCKNVYNAKSCEVVDTCR